MSEFPRQFISTYEFVLFELKYFDKRLVLEVPLKTNHHFREP